jgi:hypothetical protein
VGFFGGDGYPCNIGVKYSAVFFVRNFRFRISELKLNLGFLIIGTLNLLLGFQSLTWY